MERERRVLQSCAQKLSVHVVTNELQIFSRLLYRNKNQHRNDQAFQRLNRVSKDMRRYKSLGLPSSLRRLAKSFSGAQVLSAEVLKASKEMTARLRECAVFVSRLIDFTEKTFSCVDQRLSKSLFVAFNLVMVSCLSRFWVCLRCHLLAIAEAFKAIRSLLGQDCELPMTLSLSVRKRSRVYSSIEERAHLGLPKALAVPTQEPTVARDTIHVCDTVKEGVPHDRDSDGAELTACQALTTNDIGVPVTPNVSQTVARELDFAVPDTRLAHHHQDQGTVVHGSQERRRKQPNVSVLRLRSRGRFVKIKLRLTGSRAALRGSKTVPKSFVAKDIRLFKRPLPWHKATRYNLRLCFVSQYSSHSACQHPDLRSRRERETPQENELHNAPIQLPDVLPVPELQSIFTQELSDAAMDTGTADAGEDDSQDMISRSTEHLPSFVSNSSSDEIDNIFSILDRS